LQSHSIFVWHPSLLIGIVGGLLSVVAFIFMPILGLAALALTVGVLVLTYKWSKGKHERASKAKEAERDELKRRLDSLLSSTCSEDAEIAAGYDGWHGTVHSFSFSSQQFAVAFEQANPGKCLGDGQVHR